MAGLLTGPGFRLLAPMWEQWHTKEAVLDVTAAGTVPELHRIPY